MRGCPAGKGQNLSRQKAPSQKQFFYSLRDEVQEALDELVGDGTFTALAEKYELTDYTTLDK